MAEQPESPQLTTDQRLNQELYNRLAAAHKQCLDLELELCQAKAAAEDRQQQIDALRAEIASLKPKRRTRKKAQVATK